VLNNIVVQFLANGVGYLITVVAAYYFASVDYVSYILTCSVAVLVCSVLELGFVQALVAVKRSSDESVWQRKYDAYLKYIYASCLGVISASFVLAVIREWVVSLLFGGTLVILVLLRAQNIRFHATANWPVFRILLCLPNVIRFCSLIFGICVSTSSDLFGAIAIAQFAAAVLFLSWTLLYRDRFASCRAPSKADWLVSWAFFRDTGWRYFLGLILVSLIVRIEQIWIVALAEPDLAAALFGVVAMASVFSVASTGVMQYLLVADTGARSRAGSGLPSLALSVLATIASYFFGSQIIGAIYPDSFLIAESYLWLVVLSHTLGLAAISVETFALSRSPSVYILSKTSEVFWIAFAAPIAASLFGFYGFFVAAVAGRLSAWGLAYRFYSRTMKQGLVRAS
jgi:hypothetical protein